MVPFKSRILQPTDNGDDSSSLFLDLWVSVLGMYYYTKITGKLFCLTRH